MGHADADAAEQAAHAASPANQTDAAATANAAEAAVDNAQADGTNDDADDKRIQQTGSGALDDDVEKPLSNESPESSRYLETETSFSVQTSTFNTTLTTVEATSPEGIDGAMPLDDDDSDA